MWPNSVKINTIVIRSTNLFTLCFPQGDRGLPGPPGFQGETGIGLPGAKVINNCEAVNLRYAKTLSLVYCYTFRGTLELMGACMMQRSKHYVGSSVVHLIARLKSNLDNIPVTLRLETRYVHI